MLYHTQLIYTIWSSLAIITSESYFDKYTIPGDHFKTLIHTQ